jgi:ABC-2 type transport system permease protein
VTTLAIARAAALRLLRDRTALFFLIVLPIVLIVIVGAVAHGVTAFRVGVLDDDHTSASHTLVVDLSSAKGIAVSTYTSRASLDRAVARSDLDVGVVIPHGLAADERAGHAISIPVLAEATNSAQQAAAEQVESTIEGAGGQLQAGQFATRYAGTLDRNLRRAQSLEASTTAVEVHQEIVKGAVATLPFGYEYSAPTELVLFVFLTSLTGGAAIVESRRLGILERMSAAPLRARTIILGESLTYIAIALVQSILLVTVGALAFGVSWGNPLAAGLLVIMWCLVGAGAAMVSGTIFKTAEQASAVGPVVGITFGMLGGCMWPLAIVSSTMRTIGHITPQAWAVDAWTKLLTSHGNVTAIGGELAVLALFASGLFAISIIRLGRTAKSR